MAKTVTIGVHELGVGKPALVVAEMSGNHSRDINRALKIVDAAADAGADAIKLQTYTPDTITIDSDTKPFMVNWKGKRRALYDLYSEAYTPWKWHAKIFAHAKKRGLLFFSTPFDPTAVAFLEKLKVPCHKVASFEVVDIPLLEAIGKTRKPVIMSRGMSTKEELSLAIKTLRKFGTKDIVLLQCTSAYPADAKDMRLSIIPDLRKRFGVHAGLSDHTMSDDVVVAAIALGAVVIEKHLTLRRADGGPDSSFSLEPKEFASMVKAVRATEAALGRPSYAQPASEKPNIVFRKSLFVVKDIKKWERFTKENIRSIRPGNGMAPKFYRFVLGKRAAKDIKRATPLRQALIA